MIYLPTSLLESDTESEEIRELYAQFGLAVYLSQVLEHSIVNLLLYHAIKDRKFASLEEIEAFEEKQFRKTFGTLVKQLLEENVSVQHLNQRLNECCEARNELAHRYFRKKIYLFSTIIGRTTMLNELQQFVKLFDSVNRSLELIIDNVMNAIGIPKEKLVAYTAECI